MNVVNVLEKIEENGFEAYIVGGYVRDHLLGIDTGDIDICTNARVKDLLEIFNDIKNKALFLPTSESSRNAFVVKYSKRNQTEITRRLFIASTGSIEHVTPSSLGGLNTIGNFLLTSASGNRYRENMPLPEYIKRHPKIPKYMQMYIDDVIREIHAGNLQGNETYPYKIKKKLMEESEGRIMISLSGYKYSEKEAAEAVEEYEKRYVKGEK